jgi:hypothetical protein
MALVAIAVIVSGCTQAENVSYNLSKEADAFNITRRVTVFNTRTDKCLIEVIGLISIQKSAGDLDIIMEIADGVYKKHFVSMNDWTTYVVEDISGAYVDKYHYEINFQPKSIVPIQVTTTD